MFFYEIISSENEKTMRDKRETQKMRKQREIMKGNLIKHDF